jgi:hypothetical protein
VKFYPNRRSEIRFEAGSTFVRYLTNHPDPKEFELESLLSTQIYVTQGNRSFSGKYTIRF